MWGLPEQLLAALVDSHRIGNWQYASVHSKKGRAPKRPKPIPRPGVKNSDRRFGSRPRPVPEMRKILDNWNRKG